MLLRFVIICIILPISLSYFVSCSGPEKEIRAYIEENPHWRMVEQCGYEHCGPKVDFLTAENFSIRLEGDRLNNEYVIIRISFERKPIDLIYLSRVVATLDGEKLQKPRIFTCPFTRWELSYLRNAQVLQDPESIEVSHGCFLVFFDHPVPNNFREITLDFNDSVKFGERTIEVPLIHFRKNIGLKAN